MAENELEISFWNRGSKAQNGFTRLLKDYAADHHTAARCWFYSEAWREVSTMMLQSVGPDISEVGSTWVKSLAATNALSPIPPHVMETLGGKSAFVYTTSDQNTDESAYSIPFLVETRLMYYRKDVLIKAGVEDATAFSTPKKCLETLEALRQSGIKYPLLFPLANRWLNLSFLASWVWGTGGDFIAADGKSVIFDQDEALQGLHDFFSMAKYVDPAALEIKDPDQVYCEGGHAITLSSPWLYNHIVTSEKVDAGLREYIDVAVLPGVSYLGGTNLVVWKYSRNHYKAFELIKFLVGLETQSIWESGILPARRDVLKSLPYSADPVYQKIIKATLSGRAFSSMPLWGVVEERISILLFQLWSEFIRNPEIPPIEILKPRLTALAKRLAITLDN